MLRIILLSVGMFALGLDAYVMSGLLPALKLSLGISTSQAGQTVTVFTLCYALAAPIFATMLSRIPIRRILQIALFAFAIANILSALSQDITWLLISRGMAGIFAGIYSPMAAALAVKLVPIERRGRALALILGGMSAGVVLGVPLGLMIANIVGWQGTLLFVATLSTVAMLGISLWLPHVEDQASLPTFSQRLKILTNVNVAKVIAVTFLTSIASLGLYTYLAEILFKLDATRNISPYLWIWGVGGIIGSFSIGKLIDTRRPAYVMTCILGLLTLSLISLSYLLSLSYLAFLPMLIWGAMGWSSQAPQQHTLYTFSPEQGAQSIALNSSANYLGSSVGTGLGGILIWSGFSLGSLPLAAGFVSLLALILQVYINRQHFISTKQH